MPPLDSATLSRQDSRGLRAEHELSVLEEAADAIRRDCYSDIEKSLPLEQDKRETAYLTIRTLDKVIGKLKEFKTHGIAARNSQGR